LAHYGERDFAEGRKNEVEIIGGSTQPNKPLDVGIVFFVFVPRTNEFVLFLRPQKGYLWAAGTTTC